MHPDAINGTKPDYVLILPWNFKDEIIDPSNFWRQHAIAVAHFVAEDYTASLQESKRIARSRKHLPSAVIWAASAAALGEAAEAEAAVKDCLAQRPDLHADSAYRACCGSRAKRITNGY